MSRFGRILTGAIGGLGGAMSNTIAPLIKEQGEEKKRKEKAKKIADSLQGQFEGVEDDSSLGFLKGLLMDSPELLLDKAGQLSPAFGFMLKGLQGQESAERELAKDKLKRQQEIEDRGFEMEEFEKKELFKDKLAREAKIRELEAEKAEGVLTHQRELELERLREEGRLKRTKIQAESRKKSGSGSSGRKIKVSEALSALKGGVDIQQLQEFIENPAAFKQDPVEGLIVPKSIYDFPQMPFRSLTNFGGR